MADSFDLIVIGAGPGGYVSAIRAAQFGLNVACVEKEDSLGGTCLRVGCIPSKALLEASEQYERAKHTLSRFGVVVSGVELDLPTMMKHKDGVVKANTRGVAGLFKKNKVRHLKGVGHIVKPGVVQVTGRDSGVYQAKSILIATGSAPASIPGVTIDEEYITSSTGALEFPEVPDVLVVIGAGVIGLELGSVWSRLGSKVIVLEFLPQILPGMDSELVAEADKLFGKQGIDIRLSSRVTKVERVGGTVKVEYLNKDGVTYTLDADRVLMSVGRRAYTDELGLDQLGVERDKRGVIQVDDSFQTNVPGIYAIGDVIPGPMLAHKASDEGVAFVEKLVTGHGHVGYDAIPGVVYTEPEIASVGKTEDELKDAKVPYKKGKFPFRFNGRARALLGTDGFLKVLAHAETDRLLGVHIIGPRAGDLIAEAGFAIEMMASAEDLARTCAAHPTLGEALKEAALAVGSGAIHM